MNIQTITICGSMKLLERMKVVETNLKEMGFIVLMPNLTEKKDYSVMTKEEQAKHKNKMIVDHVEKIKKSDAILLVNEQLKNIEGYIGANSFLEMGIAFALDKKIFLLNNIPDQPNYVEMAGMFPTVLNGDLSGIKAWG